jgi:hypothetical protein
MNRNPKTAMRCAIYTRKSSEEGLPTLVQCRVKNESAPDSIESRDARSNSPPPKSAHRLPYVFVGTVDMARTCMGWH